MKTITLQTCLVILVAALSVFGCVTTSSDAEQTGIVLSSRDAVLHSTRAVPQLQIEEPNGNLGYWHNLEEYATWDVKIEKAGKYTISIKYAAWGPNAGSGFSVEIGGQKLDGILKSTSEAEDGYFSWKEMEIGVVPLAAGAQVLTMKATKIVKEALGNILELTLTPAK
jgi:hypothetical protein